MFIKYLCLYQTFVIMDVESEMLAKSHLAPVEHLFEGKRDKRRELSRNVSCIERMYIANPRVFEPIFIRKKQHLATCKHINT